MTSFHYVSPFFIVTNLRTSASFYADKLGFDILHMGPGDDPFFAIVGRDQISIMLKQIASDIKPIPNSTRHKWARWDAYISITEPDSLYKKYLSRGITFHQPLQNNEDGLLGFEVADADGYVLFFGRPVV